MKFKTLMRTDADWGITMLRIVTGVIYAQHGYAKFQGLEGTSGFFAGLGIPIPEFMAMAVAAIEGIGGGLIVIGLFTRIVSVLQGFVVLFAILLVHFDHGMFGQGGYQWALLLMAASLCLVLEGAGKASLDNSLY
jgi:putative oxidoreductase